MLLWALAVLRCGSTYTFAMLQHVLAARVERLNEQDVRSVVWAYAKSDAVCSALFSRIAERVLGEKLLGSYSPRTLAVLAWGFAHKRVRQEEVMRGIAREAVAKVGEFAPIDLANLLWGMAASATYDARLLRTCAEHVE